jgi:SAM-dependent methyltransferase
VLTVDYDKLGLEPGHLLLDMGAGNGRHAFEALKRGARVVAFDYLVADLVEARNLMMAMVLEGEAPEGGLGAGVNGDAVHLPFPDDTFDCIIAAEVLEHVPDDVGAMDELARVLKPGGRIAATIPSWLPEKICWALSEEYHAPHVEGGHVRIYTEPEVRRKLKGAGLVPGHSHHAHALHSPYWWIRCAVGPDNDDHPLVKAYHRLLVWDMVANPLITRLAEKTLQPVLGKSLIVYADKPSDGRAAPPTASAAASGSSTPIASDTVPPRETTDALA